MQKLKDNTKARLVNEKLENIRIERPKGARRVRAQEYTYKFFVRKLAAANRLIEKQNKAKEEKEKNEGEGQNQ